MTLPSDFTHVFVEPGNTRSIIDIVHPATGRSAVYDQTLDEIRERYPTAEVLDVVTWQARKAAMQDTPLSWLHSTGEQFRNMLEVLPPAYQAGGGFLVGEPDDHHAITGQPRFRGYIMRGGAFYVSSRPMTIREVKETIK